MNPRRSDGRFISHEDYRLSKARNVEEFIDITLDEKPKFKTYGAIKRKISNNMLRKSNNKPVFYGGELVNPLKLNISSDTISKIRKK